METLVHNLNETQRLNTQLEIFREKVTKFSKRSKINSQKKRKPTKIMGLDNNDNYGELPKPKHENFYFHKKIKGKKKGPFPSLHINKLP